MAKTNLEQKRFSRLTEAAIAYKLFDEKQKPLVKALIEAFNTKFKTRFYFDEVRGEIIHANLVKEATFAEYKKLAGLLESKGIKSTIKESVVQNLNGLSRLVESELAQAEIILAAQSLGDRLQKMAEDLAQMVSEDVLPISDQMKSVFGTQQAEKWSSVSKDALEEAFAVISRTKDVISNANLVLERQLEGEETLAGDMADFDTDNADSSDDLGMDDGAGAGELDDFLGGSDAASGPEEEPLGRAKKESVQYKKKSLTENENKKQPGELSSSDFSVIETYNGYVLGADEHDDGDVVKHSYYIAKPTRKIAIGDGYRPLQLYKKIKDLGLGSYVPEHEAMAVFKKTVDAMGTNEDRATGQIDSYMPIMRKTQSEQPFVLTHDGNAIVITKGHNTTDDSASFYDDEARELLHDLANTDTSEHQQILAHYYASRMNVIDRDRARISPDEWNRLSEHDDPSSYVDRLKQKGYNVKVTDRNGVKYFAISKKNDFDEFTNNSEILHVREPRTGEYIIDMDYKAKFNSLEDAVSYHYDEEPKYQDLDNIKEHANYSDYVSELESEGYTIDVTEQGDSLIFAVSRDGKTVFIEEPKDGVYQVMAFDKEYTTLKDAVTAFFNVNESNCAMVKERNAFAHAVRKAKSIGADNFEVDGKKYPVKEAGMPAGVIKSKNRYAEMSDSDLAATLRDKSEDELKQMAWRHGYGKMSDHYVKRVAAGRVKENDEEELADKAIKAIKGEKNPAQKPNPVEDKLKKDMENTIRRNPQLKMALSKMQEAINTIKEDIGLGINEKLAIRNSSMIFELPIQDLREEWLANKK